MFARFPKLGFDRNKSKRTQYDRKLLRECSSTKYQHKECFLNIYSIINNLLECRWFTTLGQVPFLQNTEILSKSDNSINTSAFMENNLIHNREKINCSVFRLKTMENMKERLSGDISCVHRHSQIVCVKLDISIFFLQWPIWTYIIGKYLWTIYIYIRNYWYASRKNSA